MKNTDACPSSIPPQLRTALVDFLYQLADDELVVGHRNSEWLGVAPDIEEDVAFASMAQDEIGHATYFYGLLEALGEGRADDLAFVRTVTERRNAVLTEQQNGDWATTIIRHYLYDLFESVRLKALVASAYEPVAQGANKMLREEYYHLLHMGTWFRRLAMNGGVARSRIECALALVWKDVADLFTLGEHREILVREGIITMDEPELYAAWEREVTQVFTELQLQWPGSPQLPAERGRVGQHTIHLQTLLADMGEVYLTYPQTNW
ncbi:phenylacetate-CoA oxygenase subunit PaaC [Alicyclobacillus fastidiosus]|uniref:Phenylacetate-CoA oxygenase subunit PaaC n=1 Tax=Alicyclobacillus fastidiosus TaxID=392011 RepID=A0ABY6ZC81_9BACL|nr:1,2-phenylacetyl-CoA epoxidase subunit PaaC [Alicyclobacillus fastidiosus]WAH39710.1 phenylacetate-CoA oxygenase subunit PaaC [Alicyclobacillus fastidiosus]GMA60933.1 phenylacetate-CoA oxygenase subunit PaaI [Alicyclobacillus fastidiosus]